MSRRINFVYKCKLTANVGGMNHSTDAIDGIVFKVQTTTDISLIYRAAVKYLLKKLGKEKDKLPKEIDVTAWLERG